ncbi:hypothetical protein D3C85_1147350 [compost metagenome]
MRERIADRGDRALDGHALLLGLLLLRLGLFLFGVAPGLHLGADARLDRRQHVSDRLRLRVVGLYLGAGRFVEAQAHVVDAHANRHQLARALAGRLLARFGGEVEHRLFVGLLHELGALHGLLEVRLGDLLGRAHGNRGGARRGLGARQHLHIGLALLERQAARVHHEHAGIQQRGRGGIDVRLVDEDAGLLGVPEVLRQAHRRHAALEHAEDLGNLREQVVMDRRLRRLFGFGHGGSEWWKKGRGRGQQNERQNQRTRRPILVRAGGQVRATGTGMPKSSMLLCSAMLAIEVRGFGGLGT